MNPCVSLGITLPWSTAISPDCFLYISVGVAVCIGDCCMYQLYTLFLINTHAILYLSVFLLRGSIVVEILTVKILSNILNVII